MHWHVKVRHDIDTSSSDKSSTFRVIRNSLPLDNTFRMCKGVVQSMWMFRYHGCYEIASALSTHPQECNIEWTWNRTQLGTFLIILYNFGMSRSPLDTRSLFEVPDPLLYGSCSGYHFGGVKEKRKQKSKVLRVESVETLPWPNVDDDFLWDWNPKHQDFQWMKLCICSRSL